MAAATAAVAIQPRPKIEAGAAGAAAGVAPEAAAAEPGAVAVVQDNAEEGW